MGLSGSVSDISQTTHVNLKAQPMATFNAGTLNGDGYGEVSGFHAAEIDWDARILEEPSVAEAFQRKVIIVGAGITGIQQAAVLLDDKVVKHDDIIIMDAQQGYGGVWQKNKYPGCACDVPAIIYTTSFWVNKLYTNFYATRSQIEDYYARLAHKYRLEPSTQFHTFVRACIWDEEQMKWHVFSERKNTGVIEHWMADVLCQCVGSLDTPKFGNTPGRERFKGVSWHTAHWRDDYDLKDKRVAIVGCGPSAAQLIPEIIDKLGHLTVYMRTPPVCVPRNDFRYSTLFRWAMRWVPGFVHWIRYRMSNRMFGARRSATDGTPENKQMTDTAVKFMESQISDPVLREKVRPDSKYYCKRPLRLDHFYTSLSKPNCTVLRDQLVSYTETGIISADRKAHEETERKFDVIIFGTGFNTSQHLEHITIRGLGGVDLQKRWAEHPAALYGLATSQFPNMFMCFGPNSATLWNPQQDNWELQARFAAKAVRKIMEVSRQGRSVAIHPKEEAERLYNRQVQRLQEVYVWSKPECVTYYKNDAGWNTYTMPWTFAQFKKLTGQIRWDEWDVIERY
ncbi:FAD NAD(P)-binding domain-containing [Fusarium acutatum]|uniref:FAD NAD(P)-binding domain-containing n=1 Tax=Fusarium acutatum TaxID=78861 RepID=A0A8H4JWC0_9HYPO|nr:FAD NAD(P)-binding domain-containing [Fusarium acutatum]